MTPGEIWENSQLIVRKKWDKIKHYRIYINSEWDVIIQYTLGN